MLPSAVKKTIAVIAILLVALIISLWHRMPGEDTRSTKVFLMDTLVELLAEGSRNQAEKAFKEAIRELKRLDTRLGYENSLIDELNRSRTLKDREVYCLVRISKEIRLLIRRVFHYAETHPGRMGIHGPSSSPPAHRERIRRLEEPSFG